MTTIESGDSESSAMSIEPAGRCPITGLATSEEATGLRSRSTLMEHPKDQDQILLEAFLACQGRSRAAVIAMNERTMITNQSASELLQPGDRRMLWQWVLDVMGDRGAAGKSLLLRSSLRVTGHCKPVSTDRRHAGAVVRLSVTGSNRPVGSCSSELHRQPTKADWLDPSLVTGWIELTDSERTVAELVARGLTNKEAGREMFVSHHTVDSHLRQIFRNFGVSSRVELARAVGEHYKALALQ